MFVHNGLTYRYRVNVSIGHATMTTIYTSLLTKARAEFNNWSRPNATVVIWEHSDESCKAKLTDDPVEIDRYESPPQFI